jgi:hypothetical protein
MTVQRSRWYIRQHRSFGDAHAPHGRALYPRSHASTSTRANSADAIGLGPLASPNEAEAGPLSGEALASVTRSVARGKRDASRAPMLTVRSTAQCAVARASTEGAQRTRGVELHPRRVQAPRDAVLTVVGTPGGPASCPAAWDRSYGHPSSLTSFHC